DNTDQFAPTERDNDPLADRHGLCNAVIEQARQGHIKRDAYVPDGRRSIRRYQADGVGTGLGSGHELKLILDLGCKASSHRLFAVAMNGLWITLGKKR